MTAMTFRSMEEPNARVVVEPAPSHVDADARRRRASLALAPVPADCEGSAPPSLSGGRLTGRGRVLVAMVWVLMIGAAVLLVVTRSPAIDSGGATTTVRIEVGDTLWEVARDVAPQADPREVVDAIVELNGLGSGGDIRPGDVVQVPVPR